MTAIAKIMNKAFRKLDSKRCWVCNGSGTIITFIGIGIPCAKCHGEGLVRVV